MLTRHHINITYRWARRIAISLVGGTVVLIGIAMIVLPGPAIVVIPMGLAILGLEFAWARRWLRAVRERTAAISERVRSGVAQRRNGGTQGDTSKSKDRT